LIKIHLILLGFNSSLLYLTPRYYIVLCFHLNITHLNIVLLADFLINWNTSPKKLFYLNHYIRFGFNILIPINFQLLCLLRYYYEPFLLVLFLFLLNLISIFLFILLRLCIHIHLCLNLLILLVLLFQLIVS